MTKISTCPHINKPHEIKNGGLILNDNKAKTIRYVCKKCADKIKTERKP